MSVVYQMWQSQVESVHCSALVENECFPCFVCKYQPYLLLVQAVMPMQVLWHWGIA